jgi:hypothetical protein
VIGVGEGDGDGDGEGDGEACGWLSPVSPVCADELWLSQMPVRQKQKKRNSTVCLETCNDGFGRFVLRSLYLVLCTLYFGVPDSIVVLRPKN